MAGGVIGLGILALPAFAQDAANADELLRVIEAQQRQLDAQQKQLDAQRQLLQELKSQIKSPATDADKKEVTVAAGKPPAEPPADPTQARSRTRAAISQRASYAGPIEHHDLDGL